MDTSIAIAIALGVLFLVILPGYLTRLEVARSRQELDQLPETVSPLGLSEQSTGHVGPSTLPLLPKTEPPARSSGDVLPSPRWAMAIGGDVSISAERERPQLRLVEGEHEVAQAAEVEYLDLASGEMYPATHIRALPEDRLMNQERPRAVASASRRPSNARRPLAHVSGRQASGRGTAGTGRASAPRPTHAARPHPPQQTPSAVRGTSNTSATSAPRYPALGMLFLALVLGAVISLVLMAFGLVSWALPVLAAGLAVADLALISALRRSYSRSARVGATSSERTHERKARPARVADKTARQATSAPARTRTHAAAPAVAKAPGATRKASTSPAVDPVSEAAPDSASRRATAEGQRGSGVDTAHERGSRDETGRQTDSAQEQSTDVVPTLDTPAEAPEAAAGNEPVDSVARRIASVRSRSWTPTPLPQPTYAPERGGADVSLQEAMAMEFASEPGRRPEIEDAMAHGRNATRPGKGDPAGMAELARDKREAEAAPAKNTLSSIDDILQRRRA